MHAINTPFPLIFKHVQPPRSSVALGKRRVNDNGNHGVEADSDFTTTENTVVPSKQAVDDTERLRYLPLRLPAIRLVSISPSLQDGKLKITLDEASLTDQLEFHVLSYVWGDTTNKKTIIVNDQLLDITQNLYDFLETARKQESSLISHHRNSNYLRYYTSQTEKARAAARPAGSKGIDPATTLAWWWIDAICINQEDLNEKNEQVPRMGDIYSMANRVWIWMGLPANVFRFDLEFTELKQALAFHAQDGATWYNSPKSERKMPTPMIEHFADYQRRMVVERSIARMQSMGFSMEPGPMMDMVYKGYTDITRQTSPAITYGIFNNFLRQLADLLGQSYFERTWIIQEYILNPEPPIALLGNFVFDLDHVTNLAARLFQERGHMHQHVQTYTSSVTARMGNLMTLSSARRRWHNLAHEDFGPSADSSELEYHLTQPEESFSHLPSGEKLNYLLHAFFTRKCTNTLDYFYGLLGMLDYRELPKSLLPDYNLSFEQVSRDYTKYIIESTGDLKIIEAEMGHQSVDCPSWVPNVKYLTARKGLDVITVSDNNKPFCFSDGGCRLTLEGTLIGEIISCSCTACPTEFTDKHLEFVEEVLVEGAAEITGKSSTEIFTSWIKAQMDVLPMLPPYFASMTSMQDLLQRYRAVCSDVPSEVQTTFNSMRIPDMHTLFNTPCQDPQFLSSFLLLARMRYCLLSTGDIMLCGLKDTDNTAMSPSHRWDDCAWALKGLYQLAVLRAKGDHYEYCGPIRSGEVLRRTSKERVESHEFDLDDAFFAAREIQQVTLV